MGDLDFSSKLKFVHYSSTSLIYTLSLVMNVKMINEIYKSLDHVYSLHTAPGILENPVEMYMMSLNYKTHLADLLSKHQALGHTQFTFGKVILQAPLGKVLHYQLHNLSSCQWKVQQCFNAPTSIAFQMARITRRLYWWLRHCGARHAVC